MADRDGEFDLIADLFAPLSGDGALGLTDDAAVLNPPPGRQIVIAKDAMVEGVHFLPDTPASLIARKLMRTNLSDLAAMGAQPLGYLLALFRSPGMSQTWLKDFASGLKQDQAEFDLPLLGGDSVSTPGPDAFSLTILGHIEPGRAVLRGGAGEGDLIFVTGTIGDAGLGLRILRDELAPSDDKDRSFLVSRHHLPEPRLAMGAALQEIATAMIDVSDGLVADLRHIANVSGLRAELDISRLPLSPAARKTGISPIDLATSGDDYELVFCAPEILSETIQQMSQEQKLPITCIGKMASGTGIEISDATGMKIDCDKTGWQHY